MYAFSKMDQKFESEFSFSMNLYRFWVFMKETRLTSPILTYAAMNRCFFEGRKNEYELTCNCNKLQQKIETLKCIAIYSFIKKKNY